MWVAFALQKLLTFFSKKFQHICVSLNVNFNESLTNDIDSFEQLGPGSSLFSIDFLKIISKGSRSTSLHSFTINLYIPLRLIFTFLYD